MNILFSTLCNDEIKTACVLKCGLSLNRHSPLKEKKSQRAGHLKCSHGVVRPGDTFTRSSQTYWMGLIDRYLVTVKNEIFRSVHTKKLGSKCSTCLQPGSCAARAFSRFVCSTLHGITGSMCLRLTILLLRRLFPKLLKTVTILCFRKFNISVDQKRWKKGVSVWNAICLLFWANLKFLAPKWCIFRVGFLDIDMITVMNPLFFKVISRRNGLGSMFDSENLLWRVGVITKTE